MFRVHEEYCYHIRPRNSRFELKTLVNNYQFKILDDLSVPFHKFSVNIRFLQYYRKGDEIK